MLAQRVFHQIAFRGKDSVSSGILHIQIANHRNESFDFFLGLLIKVAGLGFSAIFPNFIDCINPSLTLAGVKVVLPP
ncbi:MAG: hypothetical protein BWX81_00229 [Spirochaetes bacterium ADurb.Bin110]|nr:MAG: hypothetical protein BWX81_00229 [Spirochaetes bacterium ADurb.Bin110]